MTSRKETLLNTQSSSELANTNVIWILGDQHRGQATAYNLDPNALTPNLDNLATAGVNFAQAVSGFPLCCPARGSFLTGRYPHHMVPGHEYPLPADARTIAHVFNDAGYHTAYFGKWHLDGFHERGGRAAMHIVPPEHRGGFQQWIGYENNNSQWDTWVHGGSGEQSGPHRLPGFETDALTDLLLEYLRQAGKDRARGDATPFFAVLSVQPPHDPYQAPEAFRRPFTPAGIQLRPNVPAVPRIVERARRELAGYYAMIANLDWNVGRIVDVLRDTGLMDSTHLMFFSDHGDMHGSHGQFRKTGPYNESIRIPLLISGEQSFYHGRKTGVSPILFNHVDMAPTTLGLTGIAPPAWMEGTDFSGHRLAGHPVKIPDSAYLQCVVPTGHHDSVDRPWRGVVTGDCWKYVAFEGVPWLLFNLNEDPFEQVNLAHNARYAPERRRLNDRLGQWIADTGDTFNLPDV